MFRHGLVLDSVMSWYSIVYRHTFICDMTHSYIGTRDMTMVLDSARNILVHAEFMMVSGDIVNGVCMSVCLCVCVPVSCRGS